MGGLPNFEFVIHIYLIGVRALIDFCYFEFAFACLFVFPLPDLRNMLIIRPLSPSANPKKFIIFGGETISNDFLREFAIDQRKGQESEVM